MQTVHGGWHACGHEQECLCKLICCELPIHACMHVWTMWSGMQVLNVRNLGLADVCGRKPQKVTWILLSCRHCKWRQIVSGLNFIFSIAGRKHLQQQLWSGGLHHGNTLLCCTSSHERCLLCEHMARQSCSTCVKHRGKVCSYGWKCIICAALH